jgi:Gpi18-like mannosyltransferase
VTRHTRAALTTWAASRLGVAVLSFAAMWMVADTTAGDVPSWLHSWDHWDATLFVNVARFGYGGYPAHYSDPGLVAFFPGEPLLLRAVHVVVPSWVAAGLLISLIAGAVACVGLARLAVVDDGASAPDRAVLYLVLSPFAVFLAAGYSEALFLALALPAWVCARRRRWLLAGVLAGGAAGVRVTGVFLAAALVVEFALATWRRWHSHGW